MAKSKPVMQCRAHGVRGSHPVPGPETVEFGGNTTCYSVRAGNRTIILDAGSGIIALGNEMMADHARTGDPVIATILISHTHHDHTQGFPFFAPVHLSTSQFFMYGPNTHYLNIEEALAQGLTAPYFPVSLNEMRCLKSIAAISDLDELRYFGASHEPELHTVRGNGGSGKKRPALRIRFLRGYNHPKNGVLHIRIECGGKSVVYATDTEGYDGGDRRLVDFARDADLLIHDAQYTIDEYTGRSGICKQGWGHSTAEMACDVAKEAGVKRLVLHHHDPKRSDAQVRDIEAAAKKRFADTEAAREGAVWEV